MRAYPSKRRQRCLRSDNALAAQTRLSGQRPERDPRPRTQQRMANVQHLHTPTPVRAALPACVRLLDVLARPASYAGGGIGAGSEPEKEFAEIELKFKALLE